MSQLAMLYSRLWTSWCGTRNRSLSERQVRIFVGRSTRVSTPIHYYQDAPLCLWIFQSFLCKKTWTFSLFFSSWGITALASTDGQKRIWNVEHETNPRKISIALKPYHHVQSNKSSLLKKPGSLLRVCARRIVGPCCCTMILILTNNQAQFLIAVRMIFRETKRRGK